MRFEMNAQLQLRIALVTIISCLMLSACGPAQRPPVKANGSKQSIAGSSESPAATDALEAWLAQIRDVESGKSVRLRTEEFPTDKTAWARLTALTGLKELALPNASLSSDQVAEIAKFGSLEVLVLGESAISDADLVQIAGLKNLRQLNLSSAGISDKGLESLMALERLELLRLVAPGITDQGVTTLAKLKSLESLLLENASLSGHTLVELKNLKNLQSLYLTNTGIPDEAVSRLLDARPELHVHW